MPNGAIRTAFWSLMTAAGLLLAASVSDPYEVQLALSTPPIPAFDDRAGVLMLAENGSPESEARPTGASPLVVADNEPASTYEDASAPAVRVAETPFGPQDLPAPQRIASELRSPRRPGSPIRIAATSLDSFKFEHDDVDNELINGWDEGSVDPNLAPPSAAIGSPFYGPRENVVPPHSEMYRNPPEIAAGNQKASKHRPVPEPTADIFEDDLQIVTMDEVIDESRIEKIAKAQIEEYFASRQNAQDGSNGNEPNNDELTSDESLARQLIRELLAERRAATSPSIEPPRVAMHVDEPADEKQNAFSVREPEPKAIEPSQVKVQPVQPSIVNEDEYKAERVNTSTQPTAEPVGDDRFHLRIAGASVAETIDLLGRLGQTNIVASGSVEGEVMADMFHVTVSQALAAIARAHNLVVESEPPFVFVATQEEATRRQQIGRTTSMRLFRPSYIPADELLPLIEPVLTHGIGVASIAGHPDGGINSNANTSERRNDALLVVDTPSAIAEIERVVRELDVPPRQVEIDAVLLKVRLTNQQPRGVCGDILRGHQFSFPDDTAGSPFDAVGPVTTLGGYDEHTSDLPIGCVAADIDDCVAALSAINYTKVVASPHLKVLNKHKGELLLGDRIAFRKLNTDGTQKSAEVEFLESGTKLILRPTISHDGRILLNVHPEHSSAKIHPVTKLPVQRTAEVTTSVLLHDHETLVIGGLIEERVVRHESRVPVLGSLPVMGRNFRRQHSRVHRDEFIVLLTARLVQDGAF